MTAASTAGSSVRLAGRSPAPLIMFWVSRRSFGLRVTRPQNS